MRPGHLCGVLLLAILASVPADRLLAQAPPDPAAQTDSYVAPAGKAPPVAPPLRKGSPLDHLTNDPKLTALPVGYREGNTTGPDYWIAHRHVDEMEGQGWGWVRKSGDDWGDGTWIALQETLGLAVAPHRKLVSAAADEDWEFKFWGKMADYQAYDPRTNELLPVYILYGYEVIGPANPLKIKVGPPDRVFTRPSGASSRAARPIQTNPGVD